MERLSADELRAEFDASFARRASHRDESHVDLLVVQAGSKQLALRVEQIRGVHKCPPIVALPDAAPSVLGIGAIRGKLIALSSLAFLVGEPTGKAPEDPWVALCGDSRGLVFDRLLRCVRAPATALRSSGPGSPELVEIEGMRWSVADVPSLLVSASAGQEALGLG
jgi:chemotaxis signal transduction protein